LTVGNALPVEVIVDNDDYIRDDSGDNKSNAVFVVSMELQM